jgi:hypothetical protein
MSKENINLSNKTLIGFVIAIAASAITRSPIVTALAFGFSFIAGIYNFCFGSKKAEVTTDIMSNKVRQDSELSVPTVAPTLAPTVVLTETKAIAPKTLGFSSEVDSAMDEVRKKAGEIHYNRLENGTVIDAQQALRRATSGSSSPSVDHRAKLRPCQQVVKPTTGLTQHDFRGVLTATRQLPAYQNQL